MRKLFLFAAIAALTASPVFAMKEGPRDMTIPIAADIKTNTDFLNQAERKYAVSSPAVKTTVEADMVNMRAQLALIKIAVETKNNLNWITAKREFDVSFQRACTNMGGCK